MTTTNPSTRSPRRRLSKPERRVQLLEMARELIRDAGTDGFTLGRLADRAGVTKPLVYDHFGDRAGSSRSCTASSRHGSGAPFPPPSQRPNPGCPS